MLSTGRGRIVDAGVGKALEHTLLTSFDIDLFKVGAHNRLYRKLGAHPLEVDGRRGTHFAVWAPNAERVSVIGDFNGWDRSAHPLGLRADAGVWEGFVPSVGPGALYKYHVASRHNGYRVDKTDPFAFHREIPPRTASVVWDLAFEWSDEGWMQERQSRNSLDSPISIYELHLGSWRRIPEENNRWLTYRETAPYLKSYASDSGFSHVELLPVMEHPLYSSWGYQTTGYYAPTARYGTPQDMMYMVDQLHGSGIGVYLDWVPSHFPSDEHGLAYFDGTHLFEYQDPRKAYHPEWRSYIFDYEKGEVRSFLSSCALFWLDLYHADGLRTDAVSSMLYLDYSRRWGEWTPNFYGGRENLEAVSFLQQLNEAAYTAYPSVQMIAEESTAWPNVSKPAYASGLGFGLKWNMGWMHDTLHYFSRDPVYRKHDHNSLTFSIWYAFSENFVLPLSHDEVVHGKGSLLGKMPGDEWEKFANLRLMLGYMYAHPGKKLLFMGGEFGVPSEWNHEKSLDWHLLESPLNSGLHRWTSDLNSLYGRESALHELDFEPEGFEWVDFADRAQSVISFLRKGRKPGDSVLVVCNNTPIARSHYRVGVPRGGSWRELLNSDAIIYGGKGQGNLGGVRAEEKAFHGRENSVSLVLPPLGILFFRSESG